MVLIPASSLQLVWTSTAPSGFLRASSAGYWFSRPHLISNWLNFLCTELYHYSSPTLFLLASQIALIQRSSLYPDIPQPDAPVIYTGAFPILTARPGSICNTTTSLVLTIRRILEGVRAKNRQQYYLSILLSPMTPFTEEDGANSSRIQPKRRNSRSHNDAL